MKLEYLKLTNFRGFSSFEVSFEPELTVLLGSNMAGKTAVLDGAATGLSVLLGRERARKIEDHEVRQLVVIGGGVPELQRRFPAAIEVHVLDPEFSQGRARWELARTDAEDSTRADGEVYTLLNQPMTTALPVIAEYGAQRHWDRNRSADDLRGIGSRYDGYEGCFDIRSTHSQLAGWMRKQTLIQLQLQLQRGAGYLQPQLAAVEAAVKSCIDGVLRFWFDIQYDELRLERFGGDIQSFTMLSEGYRNMVAMIADIAWRASVLNPHYGAEAHLRADGVVLIDELDLHLHPAWQRRIVGDLRRTFPQIQFIVTTHSPQIVASVSRAQVRLLDSNYLVAEKPHVQGRDSNAILEDVFGVPSRPETVQAEIDDLFQLIENEDLTAARGRLAHLEERLGPDDSDMIRARWILDTAQASPNGHQTPAP